VISPRREPGAITVLDVVEAVDGAQQAFVCTEIRQRGPMATPPEKCTVPCPINRTMRVADRAWRAALRSVSIAELAEDVAEASGPEALPRIGAWLTGPR